MDTLKALVRGKDVHVDPVAAIEDLAWELAGRRVLHLPHTIWQEVGHMNFWMDYALRYIEGATAGWPRTAEETWPKADGPADLAGWRHEVALFRTNLDQLATLADARASTLSRIVDQKSGKTVEATLWELVLHNSYHIGHVVQLRQALGAWPPATGGVTW